ncbi:chemotaxis protein CheW [Sphingomonas sp. RHCKR7]|uniref:chemotaxis protein CheW n=1 Tax=Sphingomonas folli TaxID=2862497 RepID=UPI001CA4A19C|nr:chemotaxis protein CheW [Sphingomonas folli]MBW6527456.1 chemotaxis protein CheW [Sphingomonas folli]
MSDRPPSLTVPDAAAVIAWDSHGELEVLTFDVGGESFAVEAVLVRELVELLPETAVPGAPALVDAMVNFRGRIVPVADLRAAFAMPAAGATADSRIIVVELTVADETLLLGLRADRVHEVATLTEASSEDAPSVGVRWPRAYVRRLVRWRDDVIVLPDLVAILTPALGGAALTC